VLRNKLALLPIEPRALLKEFTAEFEVQSKLNLGGLPKVVEKGKHQFEFPTAAAL